MTPEAIATLIATLLLFLVGFKLGEARGRGEQGHEQIDWGE